MDKMKVIGGSLNVRKQATTDAPVIGVLGVGEIITVGASEDGWRPYGDGYVMERWLEAVPAKKTATKKTTAKKTK